MYKRKLIISLLAILILVTSLYCVNYFELKNFYNKSKNSTNNETSSIYIEEVTNKESELIVDSENIEISISDSEEKEIIPEKSETLEKTTEKDVINTSPSNIEEENQNENTNSYFDVPISKDDQDFIKLVCESYEIPEKLIYQIMETESNFNRFAISSTDDHGIMQLNAKYYSSYVEIEDEFSYIYNNNLSDYNVYDIKHNVLVAIRELDYWRTICNQNGYYGWECILECYNRGFNYFNFPESFNYSVNVLSNVVTIKEEV